MVAKAGPSASDDAGFNEKELEDIMSEIESLEAEFDDTASDDVEEVVEEEPEVAKIAAAPVQKPVVKKAPEEVKKVPVATPKVAVASDSVALMPAQMEFHVQGDMQLNLKFHVGGTWVQLVANSEEGLVIEMPGGMRFLVPVDAQSEKSKKAS